MAYAKSFILFVAVKLKYSSNSKLMRLQSNELNFEGKNIYVGIDVHLKSWTVTILTERLHYKIFSQASNMDAFVSYPIKDS